MKVHWALVMISIAILSGCSSVRPQGSSHHGLFDSASDSRASSRPREPAEGPVAIEPISTSMLLTARKLELHWPLKSVQVSSKFGRRSRDFHEGIDLRAKMGTPVFAAQDGKVIYAGKKIRGYGNMLVIKHALGIATVYAHNSRLLVRTGENVKLGQQIAISGSTGHSTGPHLHFEVRNGTKAIDPQQMVKFAVVAEAAPNLPARSYRRVASTR